MQLVFGLILTFLLFALLRQWGNATREQRQKGLFYAVVAVLSLVCVLLVVTGRIHFLAALAMAALPWVRRALNAWGVLRWWRRLRSGSSGPEQGPGGEDSQSESQRRSPPRSSGTMTIAEAREVLNVTAEATREEIVQAHRRLIHRVHPDRGGSTELAARVNEAKVVLLGERR